MYINKTSQQHIMRSEQGFSVLEGEVRGRYIVYPVYLTEQLEALAEHPMFWDDPTIDWDTRAVAAIYVPANARGWNLEHEYMSIETLVWSADAEDMGSLLTALAQHMEEGDGR